MSESDQHEKTGPEIAPDEGVIKRPDGFWGVLGLPDSTYYASEEQAGRAARELLEAAGEPEVNQKQTEHEPDTNRAAGDAEEHAAPPPAADEEHAEVLESDT